MKEPINNTSTRNEITNNQKFLIMTFFAVTLILIGFFIDSPKGIIKGIGKIIIYPDTLITDYIGVGGMGATFVNSGILTLVSIGILYKLKIKFNGVTFASLFLMAGFAFFGKNIFNVWFIILGVYLYSKYQKDTFTKYVYVSLFGTAMAPMISQLLFSIEAHFIVRVFLGVGTGVFIGFILPPLSTYLLRVHQGFNLYNIGFAAGIIGTILVSIFKSYGIIPEPRMVWTTGNNQIFSVYLFSLSISMILLGYYLNEKSFKNVENIMKRSGRLITDFTLLYGYAPSLINMGINGIAAISYILLIGGDLNGPTIGGIFTIMGFGAFGKHIKNIIPIFLGVSLGALTKNWGIQVPAIQLAALFGTALAPIAGEFGWKYGILAGFIHSSVVLNVGVLHGGLNLYNNGFAAGIVAAALVPCIEAFRKEEI
ncbi:DUF1576 domain-containing protein [Haloimpatiens sp. FM7330]|uniref:DUF1576 domain-containing protein n=1 Tax=Haloimpatiens sp. FM7330 TaxID=3298610 RepID=UPI003630EA96